MHLTAILYLTLRVKFVFVCVFSISTFTRLAKFTPFVLYMHHSLVNLTVKSALKSTDFWLKLAPFFMAHGVFFSCRKCQNYWRCPSNMVLKLRCIKVRKLLLSRPHTHTHTRLTALLSGLPGWAGTRKVKPIWILLKQETVSGSGISRAIRKSAPHSREITTPTPHRSVFTGRMPFLPPNQQHQSTEDNAQLMPLHPKTLLSLASFQSRLVLFFWYRLVQVVVEKRLLNGNGCSNSSSSSSCCCCCCCCLWWSNEKYVGAIFVASGVYLTYNLLREAWETRGDHASVRFHCVELFVFLWAMIHSSCSSDPEIHGRSAMTWSAMHDTIRYEMLL